MFRDFSSRLAKTSKILFLDWEYYSAIIRAVARKKLGEMHNNAKPKKAQQLD